MKNHETRGLPASDDMLSDDLLDVVAGGTKSKSKSKCKPKGGSPIDDVTGGATNIPD